MPRTEFDRTLQVAGSASKAWAALTDVPRLVDWLSIVEDAREIEPLASYTAVLLDRMGPFRLRADLAITIDDVEIERRLTMRAEGEDRQVGSRLAVTATMFLEPKEATGTIVRISGAYEVTGRVASMGSGSVRKKADRILDEFFGCAATDLGTP